MDHDDISQYWWLALGIIIVAFAFEGSRSYGGWFLLLIVVSMLAYAKEKGKI